MKHNKVISVIIIMFFIVIMLLFLKFIINTISNIKVQNRINKGYELFGDSHCKEYCHLSESDWTTCIKACRISYNILDM